MSRKFLFIFSFIIVLLFSSCTKKNISAKAEQKIIEVIFPEIFEYTFEDYRKRPVPPPPPANDSEEEIEKMHSAFEKAKIEHKIFLDTTKFAPLYVLLNDSTIGISKKGLGQIYEDPYHGAKFIDTLEYKSSYKIDIGHLSLGEDYIIKYKSEFSQTIDELKMQDGLKHPGKEKKHLQQFSGMLTLSRIYFNRDQNLGFLDVSFNCGKLCGCGYRVFIKKVKEGWVIEKIDNLGCA